MVHTVAAYALPQAQWSSVPIDHTDLNIRFIAVIFWKQSVFYRSTSRRFHLGEGCRPALRPISVIRLVAPQCRNRLFLELGPGASWQTMLNVFCNAADYSICEDLLWRTSRLRLCKASNLTQLTYFRTDPGGGALGWMVANERAREVGPEATDLQKP